MNIRVLSKAYDAIETLASYPAIDLWRIDRIHEQKLVLTRLFALSPIAVSRLWDFWTFLQYPLLSELESPLLSIVHWRSRINNKHTIFCVVGDKHGCLYIQKSIKRSYLRHNLGPFFSFRKAIDPWVPFFLDLALGSSHHQHVDTSNYCRGCTCLQTCNYDTREDDFLHLASHRQKNFSSSPRSGLWTFPAFVVSPSFSVGTEEDACPLPFRLRSLFTAAFSLNTHVFFAPSADFSRFPEACEVRKLQESPFEQDPFAFHCLHSPVFRWALCSSTLIFFRKCVCLS